MVRTFVVRGSDSSVVVSFAVRVKTNGDLTKDEVEQVCNEVADMLTRSVLPSVPYSNIHASGTMVKGL